MNSIHDSLLSPTHHTHCVPDALWFLSIFTLITALWTRSDAHEKDTGEKEKSKQGLLTPKCLLLCVVVMLTTNDALGVGRLGQEMTMTVKMALVVVIEMAEVNDICVELEG